MSDEKTEISTLSLLPEGCIAYIISFTSPKDACRAAAVSLGFKSAAEYDTVWERFLPPDYSEIVSGSSSLVTFTTKKELYLLLCETPLLLAGGKLSFRLNRSTGKKCYMLCARELQIVWIDHSIYWEWRSLPESRFAEVAELLSVCWLEICGIMKAEMLSPKTNYVAYIVFKLAYEHYGLDSSSKASVKLVKENGSEIEEQSSTVYIVLPTPGHVMGRRRSGGRPAAAIEGRFPQIRTDGWLEIELGEFFIGEGEKGDVHVKLCETEHLNWKIGIIVEGIEVRPKEEF